MWWPLGPAEAPLGERAAAEQLMLFMHHCRARRLALCYRALQQQRWPVMLEGRFTVLVGR